MATQLYERYEENFPHFSEVDKYKAKHFQQVYSMQQQFIATFEKAVAKHSEELNHQLLDCAQRGDTEGIEKIYSTVSWEMQQYGSEYMGCGDAAMFWCMDKNMKCAIALMQQELKHPTLHLCLCKDAYLDRLLDMKIKNRDDMDMLKLLYEYIPPVTSHIESVNKRYWSEFLDLLMNEGNNVYVVILELGENLDAIKYLLGKGIDVNARIDRYGNTLLHVAKLPKLISLLAKYGVNINTKNLAGDTALHVSVKQWPATDQMYLQTAALLSAGANPLETDRSGLTPREYLFRLRSSLVPRQPEFVFVNKGLELLQYFEEEMC